jgi:hypothetical protein
VRGIGGERQRTPGLAQTDRCVDPLDQIALRQ